MYLFINKHLSGQEKIMKTKASNSTNYINSFVKYQTTYFYF